MVHITYPILCMSYLYTYITFMVIYYTICYVLFSCTVIMYCYHVPSSCNVFTYCYNVLFMYCVHVLISYAVFMYCSCTMYFSYTVIFHILSSCTFHILYYHINFSYHFTFLYIFIYHVGSYNLMLHNLSSHSSAMLLRSYHIFSHVIFKSFVLCFMLA